MIESFRSGPAQYGVGDRVRTTKPLRQDGTFPDPAIAVGDILVAEASVGQIVDVGVYLNEHIVYAVAFGNGRLVGCLEREIDLVEEVSPV